MFRHGADTLPAGSGSADRSPGLLPPPSPLKAIRPHGGGGGGGGGANAASIPKHGWTNSTFVPRMICTRLRQIKLRVRVRHPGTARAGGGREREKEWPCRPAPVVPRAVNTPHSPHPRLAASIQRSDRRLPYDCLVLFSRPTSFFFLFCFFPSTLPLPLRS